MAMTFNADEVLAMAEQIERNGRTFYLRAAEIVARGKAHDLLGRLADWERTHEELFSSMRAALSPADRASALFDPDSSGDLYLHATADTHVFVVHKDPSEILGPKDAPAEILKKAIGFERDSILFFVGMSKAVPARMGVDKVNRIVGEEIDHVAYLVREIRRLGA